MSKTESVTTPLFMYVVAALLGGVIAVYLLNTFTMPSPSWSGSFDGAVIGMTFNAGALAGVFLLRKSMKLRPT